MAFAYALSAVPLYGSNGVRFRESLLVLIHLGPVGKLIWREPSEARVESLGIEVDPLGFDDLSCLLQARKPMLAKAFIAQSPE